MGGVTTDQGGFLRSIKKITGKKLENQNPNGGGTLIVKSFARGGLERGNEGGLSQKGCRNFF